MSYYTLNLGGTLGGHIRDETREHSDHDHHDHNAARKGYHGLGRFLCAVLILAVTLITVGMVGYLIYKINVQSSHYDNDCPDSCDELTNNGAKRFLVQGVSISPFPLTTNVTELTRLSTLDPMMNTSGCLTTGTRLLYNPILGSNGPSIGQGYVTFCMTQTPPLLYDRMELDSNSLIGVGEVLMKAGTTPTTAPQIATFSNPPFTLTTFDGVVANYQVTSMANIIYSFGNPKFAAFLNGSSKMFGHWNFSVFPPVVGTVVTSDTLHLLQPTTI